MRRDTGSIHSDASTPSSSSERWSRRSPRRTWMARTRSVPRRSGPERPCVGALRNGGCGGTPGAPVRVARARLLRAGGMLGRRRGRDFTDPSGTPTPTPTPDASGTEPADGAAASRDRPSLGQLLERRDEHAVASIARLRDADARAGGCASTRTQDCTKARSRPRRPRSTGHANQSDTGEASFRASAGSSAIPSTTSFTRGSQMQPTTPEATSPRLEQPEVLERPGDRLQRYRALGRWCGPGRGGDWRRGRHGDRRGRHGSEYSGHGERRAGHVAESISLRKRKTRGRTRPALRMESTG
jgi:hypothetical protein